MTLTSIIITALAALQLTAAATASAPRKETTLTDWEFRRDHDWKAGEGWTAVKVPHDWAITGPFSKENDLQVVAVVQNGEKQATEKTGRSGGLPYMGKGCYRTFIDIDNIDNICRTILFGLDNYPEKSDEEQWQRFKEHMDSKYAAGGYLKLWIHGSENEKNLKRLRTIIENPAQLRVHFDRCYQQIKTERESGKETER